MKKCICIAIVMVLAGAQEIYARGGGGGHGGRPGGGGHGSGSHGGRPGGGGHGFRGHGGYRGSARIWVGPGWGSWWGPSYYSPYYYYPSYYAYPSYYTTPPATVNAAPETYIQRTDQTDEDNYWYFCPEPKGYYPHVKECPKGWLKVAPTPPDQN